MIIPDAVMTGKMYAKVREQLRPGTRMCGDVHFCGRICVSRLRNESRAAWHLIRAILKFEP